MQSLEYANMPVTHQLGQHLCAAVKKVDVGTNCTVMLSKINTSYELCIGVFITYRNVPFHVNFTAMRCVALIMIFMICPLGMA